MTTSSSVLHPVADFDARAVSMPTCTCALFDLALRADDHHEASWCPSRCQRLHRHGDSACVALLEREHDVGVHARRERQLGFGTSTSASMVRVAVAVHPCESAPLWPVKDLPSEWTRTHDRERPPESGDKRFRHRE